MEWFRLLRDVSSEYAIPRANSSSTSDGKPLLPRVSSAGHFVHKRSLSAHTPKGSLPNLQAWYQQGGRSQYVRRQQRSCWGRVFTGILTLTAMMLIGMLGIKFERVAASSREKANTFDALPLVGLLDSRPGVEQEVSHLTFDLGDLWVIDKYRKYDEKTMKEGWKKTRSMAIPSIVHYVFTGVDKSGEREALFKELHNANPGWEIRFYDMFETENYVKKWFPMYYKDYRQMSEQQQQNMFRYLVVLKFGGFVFSDSHTKSMDLTSILSESDEFVSVWNTEYRSASAALNSCRVRQRGLRHDVFASRANHPILADISSRIISQYNEDHKVSHVEVLETSEKTGEGVFTDTVLAYVAGDESRAVRLLPSIWFQENGDMFECKAPWMEMPKKKDTGIADVSHDMKGVEGQAELEISRWFSGAGHLNDDKGLVSETLEMVERIARKEATHVLLPVSCHNDPSFDVMTHAAGAGEWHAGSDVSATLRSFGTWQASVEPQRTPSFDELVVSAMSDGDRNGILVDVGPGYGLTSLNAAAQGFNVIAFEAGSQSLEAFEKSVRRNNFEKQITLHKTPLGSKAQDRDHVCLRSAGHDVPLDSDWYRQQQRGYGLLSAHALEGDRCLYSTTRRAGNSVIKQDAHVTVLKISAEGWGGYVLEGFLPRLGVSAKHRPRMVSLEWNPSTYKEVGYANPLKVIEKMYSLGYHGISHSGYICDQRWHALTYNVRKRGGLLSDQNGMKQPTWCRLEYEDFRVLLKIGELSHSVETILFLDVERLKE